MDRSELHTLLEQHCTGRLDEAEAPRLCAALREDAEARRLYLEYMDLHSGLAWRSSTQFEQELVAPAGAGAARALGGWTARLRSRAAAYLRTRQGVSLAVASATLLIVLCVLAFTPVPQYVWREAMGPPPRIPAAHLTGDVDCQWSKNSPAIDVGAMLYEGQALELQSGTAEITFLGGAVATVRGPAKIAIDASGQGSLHGGKLTAHVPERAVGFTLRTPAAKLTDLGTEFGVEVAADGGEEVHVFEGRVDVALHKSTFAPVRLVKSEALRIPAGLNTQPQRLAAAKQELFPRTIERSGLTTVAPALPPEQHPPVTRGLAVWLAADGALRCENDDRVISWMDMPAGDNQKPHHAAQPMAERQPRWVASSMGGKPVIRFDGDDVLLLPAPIDIGIFNRAYEMFVVATTNSPDIQFLIGGAFEEFELHLNASSGARFIPTGFRAGGGASDAGETAQLSNGQAHLLAARLLPDQRHRGVVSVDGRDSHDLTDGDGRSVANDMLRLGMRYDGSYPLRGEIAEVLIFRVSLTDAERGQIEDYLQRKYQLSVH